MAHESWLQYYFVPSRVVTSLPQLMTTIVAAVDADVKTLGS